MHASFSPPRGLDPVLEGGVGDEDAVVTPQVPTGGLVGHAVFGDQTDGPLLDTVGVAAVRQSQVGNIDGEATVTAEAAMARERDHQVNRRSARASPRSWKVRERTAKRPAGWRQRGQGRAGQLRRRRSTRGLGRSATRVMPSVTARTYSSGPLIAGSPAAKGFRGSSYAHKKPRQLHQLC